MGYGSSAEGEVEEKRGYLYPVDSFYSPARLTRTGAQRGIPEATRSPNPQVLRHRGLETRLRSN